ncbi:MAG: (d)CMP kinase [Clostridia bacterium]|nr:(d)CMP kinase [Clostridia bacterium]
MFSVAIDGPAGAGKSTIARRAAEQLGFIYVDTGALYRTVGLAMSRANTELASSAEVETLLSQIKVELVFHKGEQRVLLNGEDVSEEIRTPQASMMASRCSALPAVRSYLLDLQRNMAKTQCVIMDGRDIGTVVLPNADVKIFLTASPEVRAKRRYDELLAKGQEVEFSDVLDDMQKRDYVDSHRETAPLKQAQDAVLLLTDSMDLEQSIAAVIKIIEERK